MKFSFPLLFKILVLQTICLAAYGAQPSLAELEARAKTKAQTQRNELKQLEAAALMKTWSENCLREGPERAANCLRAAQAGDAVSQRNIAIFFWRGDGVTKDLREAIKWATLATKNGQKDVAFPVGNAALESKEKALASSAISLLELADKGGEPGAGEKLIRYYSGYSEALGLAPADCDSAAKYLLPATEKGQEATMRLVVVAYCYGNSKRSGDITRGFDLVSDRAKNGSAAAHWILGSMYRTGHGLPNGVSKNSDDARRYLEIAAQQKEDSFAARNAMEELGELFADPDQYDAEAAAKWFIRAERAGYDFSKDKSGSEARSRIFSSPLLRALEAGLRNEILDEELKACGNCSPPGINKRVSQPDAEEYFPPSSKRLGEQGKVVVKACIDEMGRLSDATVQESSKFPRLDEAAIKYAKALRYVAAIVKEKKVPSCFSFGVNFFLSN